MQLGSPRGCLVQFGKQQRVTLRKLWHFFQHSGLTIKCHEGSQRWQDYVSFSLKQFHKIEKELPFSNPYVHSIVVEKSEGNVFVILRMHTQFRGERQ